MRHWRFHWTVCLLLGSGTGASSLDAQVLTLEEARTRAMRASPELVAARSAAEAAAARARQAGAFPNPVLSYAREQTSGGGVSNWQNIALFEQRLDILGQREARRAASRLRHGAAVARLAVREAEIGYEVTQAYATAVAADRRAARAAEASDAFTRARRITAERLAGGDVSGYANRRVGLEAARYATVRAQAELARLTAHLALAALIGAAGDSLATLNLDPSLPVLALPLALDSVRLLALQSRPELRIAAAEIEASAADARAARAEAFPGPLAGLGFKNERGAGSTVTTSGFVFQVSLPVPLWDRRRAAAAGFDAEGRERSAEAERIRRQIVREVEEAWTALQAVVQQLDAIRPHLGDAAQSALRAAEAAYSEGEITLVEWLDAVRAYQEAESGLASLEAEYVIQRAALERAVGARLN
jgi:cobalt-zinc-cadmium efflux system outer membrane protein